MKKIIETERLILREYTADDFEVLYEILSDSENMSHYPAPYDKNGTNRWLEWSFDNYGKYGFGLWAVVLKATGEFIGDCGITMQNIDGDLLPEIGYHINKRYWRRGYAKEAAAAVRNWCFTNTGFNAVYSYMTYTNIPSYSTAASIGMRRIKEYADEHGILHYVYSLTKDEWNAIHKTERKNVMRKNFGAKTWLYPMPVLIIGTFDENGIPDAMNAAWGGIYETNQVMVCLAHDHKTTKNIKQTGAFTVSFATAKTVVSCDYVGLVSANDVPDKFTKAGFHAIKSEFVNAPVIEELPLTVECKLMKFNEDGVCIGEIVNVSADESIFDENGKIDVKKLDPVIFDGASYGYWNFGEKVGQAFADGNKLK